MKVNDKKQNMLTGSPGKALFFFAVPMILGNLFQQFYNMADSVIVGRYVGENALAAVGASYSLTTVFIMVAIGGGIGASVLTSQYLGAGEPEKMKTSIYTALFTFLGLSILLAVGGYFCNRRILLALKTPENILEDAVTYLRIYFCGLPFLFMYNILSAMFNALGRSRIPLYLLLFSSVLNVALDLYAVRVLGLGVAGVAVATVVAQGVSALISFGILFYVIGNFSISYNIKMRRRNAHCAEMKLIASQYRAGAKESQATLCSLKKFYSYGKEYETEEFSGESNLIPKSRVKLYDMDMLRRGTKIAIPSIIQQSIVSIGMLLVQSVVNSFGSSVLAGYSAGTRIESICIVPMIATGNAVSTFTAQNLGARQSERVKEGYRTGLKMIAIFAVIICVILQLFHNSLIQMFLEGENGIKALETGKTYLTFISWFFALIGAKAVTDGVLRGSGDVNVYMAANLVNLGIRVLFANLLAPIVGVQAVWWAVPIGWSVNFLISFIRYKTGKWSHKKVI